MTAVFREDGTWPARRESLIILVMRGLRRVRWDFIRAVGKGSRAQVVGFILLMMFSASCCVMELKQHRGWAGPKCGSTVGAGEVGELFR